jgi:hypothetical protein
MIFGMKKFWKIVNYPAFRNLFHGLKILLSRIFVYPGKHLIFATQKQAIVAFNSICDISNTTNIK